MELKFSVVKDRAIDLIEYSLTEIAEMFLELEDELGSTKSLVERLNEEIMELHNDRP